MANPGHKVTKCGKKSYRIFALNSAFQILNFIQLANLNRMALSFHFSHEETFSAVLTVLFHLMSFLVLLPHRLFKQFLHGFDHMYFINAKTIFSFLT